jgi:putative transposase
MDFVADALFDGRCLRTLTIVDNYTRNAWRLKSMAHCVASTLSPR